MSTVANITNCSFAIKGRGHTPAAGFNNIDDGVTLDLTSFNTTVPNDDATVAYVGPGSSWVNVYRTLQPFNKTVAGGRNGAVGVGGLTLGGGISYYSPQVGFTCDSVINFEIVLPSAEIVNANATSNSDLFRALKGGGNNFGVVTRIDFNTIDTVPLYAGYLFNLANYTEDVLHAFAGIVASPDYDVHASIVTSLTFNTTSKTWSVVNVPQYTLPNPNPPVYAELLSIPNITTSTVFSIQNISSLSAEPPYPQIYELFYTSTYAAPSQAEASALLVDIYYFLNTTLLTAPSALSPNGVSWSIAIEPLPSVFSSRSNDSIFGLNTTENAIILLFSISWTNSSISTAVSALAPALVADMDGIAETRGLLRDFRYYNYAGPPQDVISSYGKSNVDFLRGVSRKYDPQGVFQWQVPGGFKLL